MAPHISLLTMSFWSRSPPRSHFRARCQVTGDPSVRRRRELVMAEKDNLELVRKSFDAWNAHDPARYGKLLDEKYVQESDTLRQAISGREAGREAMQMYLKAFPDLHLDVEQLLTSGDYVVVRWTGTGTHRGELMGIPATNRPGVVRGCTIVEVRKGHIAHEWVYWDTGHLLQQLGVRSGAA